MNIKNSASNDICCHVKDCAYHSSNDHCTASGVEINNLNKPALTSDNTCCSTFAPIVHNSTAKGYSNKR